jgi:hypothetical protein
MARNERRRCGQFAGKAVGLAAYDEVIIGSCRTLEQAVVELPGLARRRLHHGRIHDEAQCHQEGRQGVVKRACERTGVQRVGHETRDQAGTGGIFDQEIADGIRMLKRRAPVCTPEAGEAVEHHSIRQDSSQGQLE